MPSIVFPKTEKGDRSTTAFGKAVFAAAATALGETQLAEAIAREKDWRHGYVGHVGALHKAQVQADTASALNSFRAGLAAACALEVEAEAGGTTEGLREALEKPPATPYETACIKGEGGPHQFEVPFEYRGVQLRGESLDHQLTVWQDYGCMEPDCAQAIRLGAQQTQNMKGRTFVVIGAFSELGPLWHLLQAGATVAALARRKAEDWERYAELIRFAKTTTGILLLPLAPGAAGSTADDDVARAAGIDLLTEPVAAADWIRKVVREAPGQVTVGTYVYADGGANVTATAAADLIVEDVAKTAGNKKVSFAWLASPSTASAITLEAAEGQQANLDSLSWWQRLFFASNMATPVHSQCGQDMFVMNNLSVLQGPNYALAQHMRQWRAMVFSAEDFVVSTPMAPVCRTHSVTKNATMKTALNGMAHVRPLEAFHPATASALLFALLVSDLVEAPSRGTSPYQPLLQKSFHSGIWRFPVNFDSAGKLLYFWGTVAAKNTPH